MVHAVALYVTLLDVVVPYVVAYNALHASNGNIDGWTLIVLTYQNSRNLAWGGLLSKFFPFMFHDKTAC